VQQKTCILGDEHSSILSTSQAFHHYLPSVPTAEKVLIKDDFTEEAKSESKVKGLQQGALEMNATSWFVSGPGAQTGHRSDSEPIHDP
jgi:hypothetical protein